MASGSPSSSLSIVRALWSQARLPSSVLETTLAAGNLVLSNDPAECGQAVRSSFQLTAVAQGCCAAIALAERLRCSLQAGKGLEGLVLERVEVDAQQAIAEYVGWLRLHQGAEETAEKILDGSIPADSDHGRKLLNIDAHAVADWDALAGLYRTQPDPNRSVPGVVRLHTNFPHHKLGVLQLLGLAPGTANRNDPRLHDEVFSQVSREDVQRELLEWNAFELEKKAQKRRLCVTAYRSRQEWEASGMGTAVKTWMDENEGSAFRISRIRSTGPSKARTAKSQEGGRLKVVDMSRVIAGPISTRTLAAHGADVLLLSSPYLPNLPLRELDTARGKRTGLIDILSGSPLSTLPKPLRRLLEQADVFSQAYRPGGLAQRGLSAENLQTIRPGIVYAELCAFGFTGPWRNHKAYDSLTQTACGMNFLESVSFNQHQGQEKYGAEVEPKALPVQALDYAAGSLMCFATLACKCRALLERSSQDKVTSEEVEDGWKVQVSLASTAEWIQSLGQIHGDDAWTRPPRDVIPAEDTARLAEMVSSFKVRGLTTDAEEVQVMAVRHASIPAPLSTHQKDSRWTVPSHLGVDRLEWA